MNKTLLKGNAMTNDKQPDVHPLSGTHINQGSFDAAADAYEAEYNAAHQPVAVDGWVLVPVEPTNAMVEAAELDACGRLLADDIADAYSAMLSAAPNPPSAPVQQSVPSDEWQPINTADLTDDLVWLFDGVDSIEGPRTLEHDDYDRFAYWTPVTWPSTRSVRSTSPLLDKNDQKEGEKVEFLLDGARFKLSFHQDECPHCGEMLDDYIVRPLEQYREELNGQWVALVPAENDRHLKFTAKPPQPPAEAGEGAVAEVCYTSHPYKDCVIVWIGQDKPEIGTKLYTSQTTATQAAVMMKCAERIGDFFKFRSDLHPAYVEQLQGEILASIPADATAALRELMMNLAEEIDEIHCMEGAVRHEPLELKLAVDRILAEKELK
jgi:hypothetical protein